jgi:hypothetical protein
MKYLWKFGLSLAAVGLVLGLGPVARAQIQYKSGQNVLPIYEGWYKNSDGSIDLLFGYLNRNWEEDLQVPVGPDNNISGLPGGPDHGQPTIFFHRAEGKTLGREQFVFRTRVPKDFSKTQEVVWTVTAHGRTDKVVATLNPVEEVDNTVLAENRGGGIVADNKPPTVTLSAAAQTVPLSVGSVKLTAVYNDDGLPKRRAPKATPAASAAGTSNRPVRGPRVLWIYYRGPSANAVKFQPATSPITEGTSATVETVATFSEPGTYVLRALAEDPALYSTADVTVTVTGRTGNQTGQ